MKRCRYFACVGPLLAFFVASPVQAGLTVQQGSGKLGVSNDFVELAFTENHGLVEITLSAKDPAGKSQVLCRSFRPAPDKRDKGNKLFDTTVTAHRYQATELAKGFSVAAKDEQQVVVRLTGQDKKINFTQEFTVQADSPAVHVRLVGELSADKLDYLMSSWEFVAGKPDFVHSPTAKRDDPRSGPAVGQVKGAEQIAQLCN